MSLKTSVYVLLCLLAQLVQPVTTAVRGQVVDATGAVLPGAQVTVVGPGGRTATATTDATGTFMVPNLPPGRYRLTAAFRGFSEVSIDVDVIPGQAISPTIRLPFGATTDPGPPPVLPAPRYHVAVAPLARNQPNRVTSGSTVTARLWISPDELNADSEIGSWMVNPLLVQQRGQTQLTAYMTCHFCKTDVRTAALTYDGQKRRSTEAQFRLDPDRTLAGPDGSGQLDFTIMSGGQLIDKLSVTVFVEPAEGQVPVDAIPGPQIPVAIQPSLEVDPSLAADLTFVLLKDRNSGQISVEIHADSEFAQRQLQGLLVKGNHWKSFPTNATVASLDDVATRAFLGLKQLIESDPQKTALLDVLNLKLPAWSAKAEMKMTDADREGAFKVLRSFGGVLYNELFDNNNPELTDLMAKIHALNAPPGRSLRVVILSNGIVCPWSMLRNPVSGKDDQFWGFKYELSVVPITLQGRVARRQAGATATKDVLYAASPDESRQDSIGWLAAQQFAHLNGAARANSVLQSRKRKDLLDELKASHGTVRLIVTFIHGSDGTLLGGDPRNPTRQTQATGARLMFRLNDPDESFTPFTLKQLKADLKVQGDFFRARPVVVLNACESGSAGFGVATTGGAGIGFPFALLSLGASGVVATDAPVWGVFALRFGTRLVDNLMQGDPLPKAVQKARLSILQSDNNPLGLLYSSYGPPNVTYSK